jgi:hypothetical protein
MLGSLDLKSGSRQLKIGHTFILATEISAASSRVEPNARQGQGIKKSPPSGNAEERARGCCWQPSAVFAINSAVALTLLGFAVWRTA